MLLINRCIAISLFAVFCSSVSAEQIVCQVIGITDGDTIKARCDNTNITVRLAEIDAPERKQPFGTASRQSLAAMCFQKSAELRTQGNDRYGRTLAVVVCNGVNANREQVRRGMAWMYDRYATQSSWYADQAAAKRTRIGLWQGEGATAPVPPWEWRASNSASRIRPRKRA